MKNKKYFYSGLAAIFCTLIVILGWVYLVYGTTIGTNVTTADLTVSGNASTTGTFIVGGALTAATVNTGQGAYELYAMNQNVQTTDSPTFANLYLTGLASSSNLTVSTNATTTNLAATGVFRSGSSAQFYIDSSGNASTTGGFIVGGTTILSTTTIGSGGTAISKHLSATTSISLVTATANTCTTATTTVTGAADGDVATFGLPNSLGGLTISISWVAWVQSTNVGAIKGCTGAATTTNPSAAAVRVDVWKH